MVPANAMAPAGHDTCVDCSTDLAEASVNSKLPGVDVEGLKQKRPHVFSSATAEVGFCFALLASIFMTVRILSPPFSVVNRALGCWGRRY